VNVYSNALYVCGFLYNLGGQPRSGAAAVDLATGAATAWDPKVNIQAQTCSGAGGSVYLA